jgi:hypothetical protein
VAACWDTSIPSWGNMPRVEYTRPVLLTSWLDAELNVVVNSPNARAGAVALRRPLRRSRR